MQRVNRYLITLRITKNFQDHRLLRFDFRMFVPLRKYTFVDVVFANWDVECFESIHQNELFSGYWNDELFSMFRRYGDEMLDSIMVSV